MISDENKAAGQDAWALRHGRSGEFPLKKTTTGIRLFILLLAWSLALAPAALAAEAGGSMPTVYNAANEKAVALFLDRKIRYLQIPELIGEAMERHSVIADPTVEDILAAEQQTYEYIAGRIDCKW